MAAASPRHDLADIKARLDANIEALATHLLGKPSSRSRSELRFGDTTSPGISVEIAGAKRGEWFDHYAGIGGRAFQLIEHHLGQDFRGTLDYAAQWLGLDTDSPKPAPATKRPEPAKDDTAAREELERRHQSAVGTWHRARPLRGSPGEIYLREARGIVGDLDPDLIRYLPRAWGPIGAVAFRATNADGDTQAVQLVYVTAAGHKATLGELGLYPQRKPDGDDLPPTQKRTRGTMAGAAVRLPAKMAPFDAQSRHFSSVPLILAEGPENGLSAWQATGFETWIYLGGSNLRRCGAPADRPLIVVRDGDAPGSPADKAFRKQADELVGAGCSVRVTATPLGRDANDILREDGTEALADLIAAAKPWSDPDDTPPAGPRDAPLSVEDATARLEDTLSGFFDRSGPFALARAEQKERRAAELDPYTIAQLAQAELWKGAPPPGLDLNDTTRIERRIRARIGRQIAADLKAKYGLPSLVRAPLLEIQGAAGLGKTARTVQQIMARPDLWGLHIWIFVPTITLAERLAEQFGPGPRVKVMRGRLAPKPESRRRKSRTMCERPAVVDRAARASVNIFKAACNDGEGRKCPFYDGCAYIAQWQNHEPGVRIFASEYLHLPKPLGIPAADLIVIDESIVEIMAGEKHFSPEVLTDTPAWKWKDDGDTADLMGVLKRVREAIEDDGAPLLAALRARGLDHKTLLTAARIADGGEDYSAGVNPETPDDEAVEQLTALEQSERVKIAKLLHQLAREIEIPRDAAHSVAYRKKWRVRVNDRSEHLNRVFVWWRKRLLARRTVPVLLLDADADPEINRQFFGERLEHVGIPVRRNATVTQCRDATLSRFSLLGKDNIEGPLAEELKAKTDRRMARLRGIIARKAAAGSCLVVMPKPVRLALTGEGEGPLPLSIDWSGATVTHFGRIRGVDDWKGHDTVIIVGREQPPPFAAEGLARSIWWDSPEPLQFTGTYTTATRRYRMRDGTAPTVTVQVHADPRVQRAHELKRERESAQAIDRLRLVHAERPKEVLILSSLPLDIEVDRLSTWREIAEGGGRFERAFASTGILPLSPADLAAAHPSLWATPKAAERALAEDRKTTPIAEIDTISRLGVVSRAVYRRIGARGPVAQVLIDSRLPDPRLALEKALGELSDFRIIAAPSAPEAAPDPPAAAEVSGLVRKSPPPLSPVPLRPVAPIALDAAPLNGWRYAGRDLYDGERLVGHFGDDGALRLIGETWRPPRDPFSLDDYGADERPHMVRGERPPLRDVVGWYWQQHGPGGSRAG